MSQRRIGIYSGTFNPVHAGHIMFALQALDEAGLDTVYFMPERRPHHKQQIEHYGHRVAMLRRALKPHARLQVLETDDISFTVRRTFPRLKQQFSRSDLVFLMGSDVVAGLRHWPAVETLLAGSELVVGRRADTTMARLRYHIAALPINRQSIRILESLQPAVSSSRVRQGLYERRYVPGLLSSVAHYSNRNWLYVDLQ